MSTNVSSSHMVLTADMQQAVANFSQLAANAQAFLNVYREVSRELRASPIEMRANTQGMQVPQMFARGTVSDISSSGYAVSGGGAAGMMAMTSPLGLYRKESPQVRARREAAEFAENQRRWQEAEEARAFAAASAMVASTPDPIARQAFDDNADFMARQAAWQNNEDDLAMKAASQAVAAETLKEQQIAQSRQRQLEEYRSYIAQKSRMMDQEYNNQITSNNKTNAAEQSHFNRLDQERYNRAIARKQNRMDATYGTNPNYGDFWNQSQMDYVARQRYDEQAARLEETAFLGRLRDRGGISRPDGGGRILGRRGFGLNQRQLRYVTQNLGFGFEDALISYDMAGTRAAARAATNNVTAIAAATIPNPFVAAGVIASISTMSVMIGPLTDAYEKSFHRMKLAAKEFGKEIDAINHKARTEAAFRRVMASNDLGTITTELRSRSVSIDDLTSQQTALRNEQRDRERMLAGLQRKLMMEQRLLERGQDTSILAGIAGGGGIFQASINFAAMSAASYMFPTSTKDTADALKMNIAELQKEIEKVGDEAIVAKRELEQLLAMQTILQPFVDLEKLEKRFAVDDINMMNRQRAMGRPFSPQELAAYREQQMMERLEVINGLNGERRNKARQELLEKFREDSAIEQARQEGIYQQYLREEAERKARTLKEHEETAKRLKDQMESELDERKALEIAYRNQVEEINALKVSDLAKKDLLGLAKNVFDKNVSELEKSKDKSKKNDSYTPLTAIDAGSREDFDMRMRFMYGSSSDPAVDQRNRIFDLLNDYVQDQKDKKGVTVKTVSLD